MLSTQINRRSALLSFASQVEAARPVGTKLLVRIKASARRTPVAVYAGPAMSSQLPPPNLGSVAPANPLAAPLPSFATMSAGLCIGYLYAQSQTQPQRAAVDVWAAPVAGALAMPLWVAGSQSPLTMLASAGLGVLAYQRAIAPLNKRLGGDAGSDELCRLAVGVGSGLLAALQV